MSNGQRLDAMCTRPGKNGKTYWTKIGAAFPTATGGWTVVLDAMPASQDGQYRIVLTEPRQQQQPQQSQQGQQGRSGWGQQRRAPQQDEQAPPVRDALDDEIPF